MVRFGQLLKLYDDWNGTIIISDDNLEVVIKCHTAELPFKDGKHYESYKKLRKIPVAAFGYYGDREFCVRLKCLKEDLCL